MINIRSIDLNLLGVFSVLMNVQNLTHAAEELGMTQSAVSHALKRLRTLYNDPLFERKSGKMMPTSKADSMYPLIQQVLLDIQSTLPSKDIIPPEKLNLEYRINMVNVDSMIFMHNFIAHIHAIAPNIIIKLTSNFLNDPAQALRNREYDLHIDLLKFEETGCHSKQLFEDELVVMVAKSHPRLSSNTEITLQEYLAEKHAVFIPRDVNASTLSSIVDFTHKRKVGFESQNMVDMLTITSMTEMVTIMPKSILNKFDNIGRFNVQALKAPFITLKASSYMNWYWGVEHYPSHRWLRQELVKIACEFVTNDEGTSC